MGLHSGPLLGSKVYESGFSSKTEPIVYMHACVCVCVCVCVCDTATERLIFRDFLTRWWRLPCPKSAGQADNLWTLLAASDEVLWVLREGSLGEVVWIKRSDSSEDWAYTWSRLWMWRTWTGRENQGQCHGRCFGRSIGGGGRAKHAVGQVQRGQWASYAEGLWGPGACWMAERPSPVPPSLLAPLLRGLGRVILLPVSFGFDV